MSEKDDEIYRENQLIKNYDDFDDPDDPEPFDPFDEGASSSVVRADEVDQDELERIQNQIRESFKMQSSEDGKPSKYEFDRNLTYNEVRIIPEVSEIEFTNQHTEVIVYDLKDFRQKTILHQRYPDLFNPDGRGLSLRTFKDNKKIN